MQDVQDRGVQGSIRAFVELKKCSFGGGQFPEEFREVRLQIAVRKRPPIRDVRVQKSRRMGEGNCESPALVSWLRSKGGAGCAG